MSGDPLGSGPSSAQGGGYGCQTGRRAQSMPGWLVAVTVPPWGKWRWR